MCESVVNPVFATNAFWQPYLTLEPGEVSEDDFRAQLEGLGRDFTVRDGTIHYDYSGHPRTAVRRSVEFPFACGDRFSMVIEYEPSVSGCSRTLFLADAGSGTRSQLGWWDLARWHPYCLRPAELDSLLEFWGHWDHRWTGQEVPLLLLCQFVGLPDAGARDSLAARAQAALRSLGLSGSNARQVHVPLHVPDGDYRWEADAELGWVFTGDDYECYSIRNRLHADSDEGRFPFTAFRGMMDEVQRRLDRG
jgi:hypothetical protein